MPLNHTIHLWPAHCRGESAPMAKLVRADVLGIHRMAGKKGNGITATRARTIAKKYKITPVYVRRVLRGLAWGEVWEEVRRGVTT